MPHEARHSVLTNEGIRNQFQYREPRDQEDVDARRKVREMTASLAVVLNETLTEGASKTCAIDSLVAVMNHALTSLMCDGPRYETLAEALRKQHEIERGDKP